MDPRNRNDEAGLALVRENGCVPIEGSLVNLSLFGILHKAK